MIYVNAVILFYFTWNIQCQTLFFKDLSSKKPYSSNHLYRSMDYVFYRDSISYFQDDEFLLISTNNSIVKLDINTLNILQTLNIQKERFPSPCYEDKYAEKYPCHLFGYWTKIIPSPRDLSDNHQLFICHNTGIATYHNMQNLEIIPDLQSKCPTLSIISLISSDWHIYVGDLKGGPKILRFKPEYRKPFSMVEKERLTTSIESSWIQQNDYFQFTYIFENGDFVYVMLRETADEDTNYCNVKNIKSRIVRISKSDSGGSAYHLRNTWISFMKATIICPDKSQSLKDSSLNFVENAYFDSQRKLLYVLFSSRESAPETAAICLYLLSDIEKAFEGLYMNVKNPKNPVPRAETTCPNNNKECIIYRTSRYQLKFTSILPNMGRNLILKKGEIWNQIQVLTIDRTFRQYEIVFIATSKGYIKKYFRKLTDTSLCYSETIILTERKDEPLEIRDMKLINSKNSPQPFLIVTTNNGVYKMGIEHCLIQSTEDTCTDLFCYWEKTTSTCNSIYQITVQKLRQLPEIIHCKNDSEISLQLMEPWSSWNNCNSNDNNCQCRSRNCKYGACVNIDQSSGNIEVQVKNCTDHHQWSTWNSWSECSSKCGLGKSTRERWCFQNGNCPGDRKESKLCFIENECKTTNFAIEWNEWSQCSSKCGNGVSIRKRKCQNGFVQADIQNNICSLIEFKACNGTTCKETSKFSEFAKLKTFAGDEYYVSKCHGTLIENEDEMILSIENEIFNYTLESNFIWTCWSPWTSCFNHCLEITDDLPKRSRQRVCKIDDKIISKDLCIDHMLEEENCVDNLCLKMGAVFDEKGFQLMYVIMVGVASFSGSCLLVVAGVCIYFAKKKPITKYTKATLHSQTSQRKSFMRESYSPTQPSPGHSPFDPGWVMSDPYTSLTRVTRRPLPNLVNMPLPMIS